MLRPIKIDSQKSLFFSLGESLDQKHPLYILSGSVDWNMFERAFSKLYSSDNGAPAKPIRLMVGLLILKHVRNLSDENLVEQWSENNYYQYFCGQDEFVAKLPCVSTELVMFRQRIGIDGCELIFKESIRVNGKDGDESDISADTTVQEKNITYPTDNKLHRKIISKRPLHGKYIYINLVFRRLIHIFTEMIKKQEQSRMADYLTGHRKIKDQFFSQLSILLDWEKLEKIVNRYYVRGESATGRPSYPGIVLFKMSLLQTWYGLSDYEVEDRVNDSISFSRFVGLSLEDSVPDHSVLSRFRSELSSNKAYEKLLTEVNRQLESHNILVKTGAIIDASIVDSPLKPKSRPAYKIEEDRSEEPRSREDLQAERLSKELIKEEHPGVDSEAAWIKKGKRSRYGYKKHVITDEQGLILGVVTTPANINEISNLDDVLQAIDLPENIHFYGDKGYRSKNNEELLKKNKLKSRILYKANKNKALSDRQKLFNKLCGKIRFKVERTFGSIRRWFNSSGARYKGLKKMHAQNVLESIAYNLYRSPNRIFEIALNQ